MKTFIHTTIRNIDGSMSPVMVDVILAVSTKYVEHYRVFTLVSDEYRPYSPIVFD